MAQRKANAKWEGGLQNGKGEVALGSGAFKGNYSFKSRFEEGTGTKPEELIGAAHAGCFSMALANGLEQAGFKPESIETQAVVSLEKAGEGFKISKIQLTTRASIPDISSEDFDRQAKIAKDNCPVSQALAGVAIDLEASLQ